MTREERNWILYDWANSAYAVAITTAILPIYFKNVAAQGLDGSTSTAYWGYGNALATLCVALLAPILGTMADYRGNKRRYFVLFTLWGVVATAALAMVGEGDWGACLAIYVLSSIGYAAANIFYDAFLVDVTETKRMDWVSSSGFGWGYIGSVFPFIASILIITNPGWVGLETKVAATRLSFILTAVWWLVFSMPMITGAKQRYGLDPAGKRILRESLQRLKGTLSEVRKYRAAFLFLIAYFFYIDGVGTIIKMAGVFGADIGINTDRLMIIFLVIQIVAFPFALLYGKLAGRFGVRSMLLTGIGVYIIVTSLAVFIRTEAHFWVLSMLVASSQGGIQALSRSAFGALIPKERSAEFFGFYNVFGKFAAVLGPLLIAITVQATGSTQFGVFSLIVLFLIGGALLLRIDGLSLSGNASPGLPDEPAGKEGVLWRDKTPPVAQPKKRT